VDKLSQLILVFLAAGLLLALVNGGWTGKGGAEAWFKAKFLGKTTGSGS
jgi:hypothetical protein